MKNLLDRAEHARVAVLGDLCLDYYIYADMRLSELSRETPHFPLPVVGEKYSAGGAANVACNAAALKPEKLTVLGVIGNDWRGGLLRKALSDGGCETSMLIVSNSVTTNAYVKTIRKGISDVAYEDPRIDFENRAELPAEAEDALCAQLEIADYDVLLVSDQLKYGCITPKVRKKICGLGAAGKTVLVDSRDRIHLYRDVIVKPNEVEAARAFAGDARLPESSDELIVFARKILPEIAECCGGKAVITLGALGCLVYENGKAVMCDANRVEPPVDIVGAGDTFLAVCGTYLAAGLSLTQAAKIANFASSVTVKKIGTTGTATRAEILAAADGGDTRKDGDIE